MSDRPIPQAAAIGFQRGAASYEAGRPSHPADVASRVRALVAGFPDRFTLPSVTVAYRAS